MELFEIVLVDQVEFPHGIGKNKKDARAAAARHAMACLLDIHEEQLNHQNLGRTILHFHLSRKSFSSLGQNQIFIDRHGHTLNSHYLSDSSSLTTKQIDQYAQKLLALAQ